MPVPRYTPYARAVRRFRRSPQDPADYAPPELRNPGLEGLLDPLALRAVGLDQPLAVAGQIPQLTDGRRRDEAAPQQSTFQQLRQPGGIADVGLAAGQEFDVAGGVQ